MALKRFVILFKSCKTSPIKFCIPNSPVLKNILLCFRILNGFLFQMQISGNIIKPALSFEVVLPNLPLYLKKYFRQIFLIVKLVRNLLLGKSRDRLKHFSAISIAFCHTGISKIFYHLLLIIFLSKLLKIN